MMSPLMAPDVPHQFAPPPHLNASLWSEVSLASECSAFPLRSIFSDGAFHEASNGTAAEPCEFGWSYDTQHYGVTATSHWNLVCADDWKRSGLQSSIMIGSVLGVAVAGKLADAFGRKVVFYACVMIGALSGVSGTFAPSLFWFNCSRAVLAGCSAGLTAAIVTLFMEIMPSTDRVLMNVGFGVGYVVPVVFIGLLSYALRDFRLMQLALGVSFLLVIPFYPFVEESPKWLLTKGKSIQAERAMRNILKRSRRPIPDMTTTMRRLQHQFKASSTKSQSMRFGDLFRSRTIAINIMSIFLLWFCESITYYHIMLSAHKFQGNPQLNYALSASAEIPAALIGIWVCRRFGRRISQIAPLSLTVICFALKLAFVSADAMWPNILTLMWIRFLLKSQNFTQWIAIHENFPTPVRSTGFALCHMFSRAGAAAAPFIVDLGKATHFVIPHAIFFVSAAIECLCLYRMPETLNEPLPDTLENLKEIYAKQRRLRK